MLPKTFNASQDEMTMRLRCIAEKTRVVGQKPLRAPASWRNVPARLSASRMAWRALRELPVSGL